MRARSGSSPPCAVPCSPRPCRSERHSRLPPARTAAHCRAGRGARAALVAALVALAAAPLAHAEKADREKPINFSGDTGDADLQERGGALAGNVIITQGTLTIRADRIVFRQNADNSLSATAFGNPVAFRQKRDGADEYYEGYAQRIEYDGSKELVELFDNALLKRGQDEIRSNYISLQHGQRDLQGRGPRRQRSADRGRARRARARDVPAEVGPAAPGRGKDGGKDAPKDAAQGRGQGRAAGRGRAAATLKPAGELAPPPSR